MALALDNPTRHMVNLAARAMTKGKLKGSMKNIVADIILQSAAPREDRTGWAEERTPAQKKRDARKYRGTDWSSLEDTGNAAQNEKNRFKIRKQLQKMLPGRYKGGSYWTVKTDSKGRVHRKKHKTDSYPIRRSHSNAAQYLKRSKVSIKKGKNSHRLVTRYKGDDGAADWIDSHVTRRARGVHGQKYRDGTLKTGKLTKRDWRKIQADAKAQKAAWKAKGRFGKATKKRGFKGKKRVSPGGFSYIGLTKEGADAELRRLGMQAPASMSHAKKMNRIKMARANGLALTNGSALLNPSFGNLGGWFTGYALPIAVAGAAAGGIHAFANFGMWDISNKINDMVIKVPWAGEKVVTYLPNTFQGLIAGAALGLVATRTKGDVRKYLGLTSVAVLSVGAAMDAYNLAAARMAASSAASEEGLEDLGALALDNFGGIALDNMGALALDNMGGLALDNFGDGMAYETAPLAGEHLYGQATLGDAYYSGADFSLGEGQALLNGSQVWVHKFGRPATRTKRAAGSASHLAGTRGHRWGWLIKLVGFQRAGSIAAMKPKQRLRVIKSLRAGAIKGYQQATLEQRARAVQAATPSVEELVAKTSAAGHGQIAPQGAGGPCGPGGLELAYGDPALFMGA